MKKLLLVLPAFLLVACDEISTADSDEVKTSGIDALYEVSTEGDSFVVTATLTIGDGDESTYLMTSGGDQLIATFNGESKTLGREAFWHEAEFSAGSGELIIDFERSEFVSAMDSSIDLSGPGSLNSDSNSYTYQSNETVELSYTSQIGTDDKLLSWDISCGSGDSLISRYGSTSDGLGASSASVALSEVFAQGPQLLDYPSGCDVAFTLTKDFTGSLSSEFNGGEFNASVDATTSVVVMP